MALETEIATYQAHLNDLLDHEGEWVVIHQDRIAGTWQTFGDAMRAGYKEFGLNQFAVKQIHAIEPVYHYTHELPSPRQ